MLGCVKEFLGACIMGLSCSDPVFAPLSFLVDHDFNDFAMIFEVPSLFRGSVGLEASIRPSFPPVVSLSF